MRQNLVHQTRLAMLKSRLRASTNAALLGGLAIAATVPVAHAQKQPQGTAQVLTDEILVTARKRSEASQDVPLSISAYGSAQLEALKVRDLTNLSVSMPNVALDDVGTTRGAANFSIRGLGINSSIPSIDPTVGLIVDGVYIGQNNGVLFDTFDVQSVEVLRGPQGTLFGRNVTGGAVLLNTKKPGDELSITARVAADQGPQGGLSKYAMASVGGPLSDWIGLKLTGYYNHDSGWIKNQFDGKTIGKIRQVMFRPVVVLKPTENLEFTVRYEHDETTGDGPVNQSHVNGFGVRPAYFESPRDAFEVSIDEPGYQKTNTDFLVAETKLDVSLGDGTFTNIFGWRDYYGESLGDIDSQPVWLLHGTQWLRSQQFSDEFRYNGHVTDKIGLTMGAFWFTNDITFHERRELGGILTGNTRPAAQFDGGGLLNVESLAFFGQSDFDVTRSLTLTGGLRYSTERKAAKVASLSRNINKPCNIVLDNNCPFDFKDNHSWSSWSHYLGFTYKLSNRARIYGSWSTATRSGGYNLRNTSFNPADVPGPFDQESVSNLEIGFKSEFRGGRFNLAAFHNKVNNMQRELNLPGPIGVIQLIRNTADATLLGLEADGSYALTDNLVLTGSLGLLHAKYDKVIFDISGDGKIDDTDKNLLLPRAAKLTYAVGLSHDLRFANGGYLNSRVNYSYRSRSAYTDNNLGYIDAQPILDASFDFHTADKHWVISVYGRNLLNTVKQGGDTALPTTLLGVPLGGTFSPISKGRRLGMEITFTY